MPRTEKFRFNVEELCILDRDGRVDEELEPKLDKATLSKIYRNMLMSRLFDEKLVSLQRSGRIGTLVPCLGQEAIAGAAAAMSREDWLVPSYRESAALFYRGVPVKALIRYWRGDERGNMFPKECNCFVYSLSLATQLPIASGIAYAAKLMNKRFGVLAFVGDGATSEGDFHEALNFAGVNKLGVVFIVSNNHYAISTKKDRQTGSQSFAQKGIAYGMSSIIVDGNDPLSLYVAVKEGLARKTPFLIESVTYRTGMHTTSDDPKRYMDPKELQEWKKKDPLIRFEKYLVNKGINLNGVADGLRIEIETAVSEVLSEAPQRKEDIYRFMYEKWQN